MQKFFKPGRGKATASKRISINVFSITLRLRGFFLWQVAVIILIFCPKPSRLHHEIPASSASFLLPVRHLLQY
jgi:hypothetical protein